MAVLLSMRGGLLMVGGNMWKLEPLDFKVLLWLAVKGDAVWSVDDIANGVQWGTIDVKPAIPGALRRLAVDTLVHVRHVTHVVSGATITATGIAWVAEAFGSRCETKGGAASKDKAESGRPERRQSSSRAAVDPQDAIQRAAVRMATEYYRGTGLEPTRQDIMAVRAMLTTEGLSEMAVSRLLTIAQRRENAQYWPSPAALLRTVGNTSVPAYRRLLERDAVNRRDGGDDLPF